MKNIIVVGPPRIGKTTLSKMIVNQISCYSAINVDVIRESIYKSICIDMKQEERKNYVKNIFPSFLKAMLNQYIKFYNPEMFYVIEGDLLSIEDAIKIKEEYDVDVVCIGTPNINENELFDRIRNNAAIHKCWTKKLSDNELNILCTEIIEQSIKEKKISQEKGLIYIDNSKNNNTMKNYINSIKNI